MRYIVHLVVIFFAISTVQPALADNHAVSPEAKIVAAASSWTNQSGSVASLSFQPSSTQPDVYTVSGYYVNNEQGYACQGTPYPLSGIYYVYTTVISFSVAWSNSSANCQSVTGWTGYIDFGSSPPQMVTNWNLAYSGSGGEQIAQGEDTFTQTSIVTSKTLTGQ